MDQMAESRRIITCKAAVCWGRGEPVRIEEIQVEPPKKGEVRVRMLYASICHTDLLFLEGRRAELFPRVAGHEGVGIVESIGEGVAQIKEGDTVIPTFLGHCGECPICLSNKANICFRYPLTVHGLMTTDQTSRISVRGQKLYHAFTCSTFSEYTVADVNYVCKIEPKIPPPVASIIACGFSTGYGAPWKEAKVEKGESVVVIGLGAVGLGAVAGAKSRGASRIIGVDINDAKKDRAINFGVTDFVNPRDLTGDKSISAMIKDMTYGVGVDYSFECSGADQMIEEALESTMPGKGVTIWLGANPKSTDFLRISAIAVGKTIKRSSFGGLTPQHDIPIIADECLNKELKLEGLITHEVEFSDINRAFEMLKQPDCLKVGVKFNDSKVRD